MTLRPSWSVSGVKSVCLFLLLIGIPVAFWEPGYTIAAAIGVTFCLLFKRWRGTGLRSRLLFGAIIPGIYGGVTAVLGGAAVIAASLNEVGCGNEPHAQSAKFTSTVRYNRIQKAWLIHDEVIILAKPQDYGRTTLAEQAEWSKEETAKAVSCGWIPIGMLDDHLWFGRDRALHTPIPFFPLKSVIDIPLPHNHCLDTVITPNSDSFIHLISPECMVITTSPPPERTSKDEIAKLETSDILVQKIIRPDDDREETDKRQLMVRVAVLSPLLQFPLVASVVKVSLWEPLKWFALGLCAAFGDKIKEQIWSPLAGIMLLPLRKFRHFFWRTDVPRHKRKKHKSQHLGQ